MNRESKTYNWLRFTATKFTFRSAICNTTAFKLDPLQFELDYCQLQFSLVKDFKLDGLDINYLEQDLKKKCYRVNILLHVSIRK